MADLTFTTTTHKVLGTTRDGLKIVSSTYTTADGGLDKTHFTVTPLKKIIAFFPTFKRNVAGTPTATFGAGNQANQFAITAPGGGLANAVIEVISFGV